MQSQTQMPSFTERQMLCCNYYPQCWGKELPLSGGLHPLTVVKNSLAGAPVIFEAIPGNSCITKVIHWSPLKRITGKRIKRLSKSILSAPNLSIITVAVKEIAAAEWIKQILNRSLKGLQFQSHSDYWKDSPPPSLLGIWTPMLGFYVDRVEQKGWNTENSNTSCYSMSKLSLPIKKLEPP